MSVAGLGELRAWVLTQAESLDPTSRYVRELLLLLDGARSVAELEARLDLGCRGQRHAGPDVFARMSLKERLLANLITPETTLFRFSEGELEAIDLDLLPRLRGRAGRFLVLPCSHGEEAFTLAAYLLKVGVEFSIDAHDVQPALIEEARTGRLTFGYPLERLAQPGYVSPEVLARIQFSVADAFALPAAEPYDLILCRNFLGYFVPEKVRLVVAALRARLRPGGALFLDGFILSKQPALRGELLAQGGRQSGGRPVFFF